MQECCLCDGCFTVSDRIIDTMITSFMLHVFHLIGLTSCIVFLAPSFPFPASLHRAILSTLGQFVSSPSLNCTYAPPSTPAPCLYACFRYLLHTLSHLLVPLPPPILLVWLSPKLPLPSDMVIPVGPLRDNGDILSTWPLLGVSHSHSRQPRCTARLHHILSPAPDPRLPHLRIVTAVHV